MIGMATLTSKNQLTLPVSLVREMGLSAGVKMLIKRKNGKVLLEKAPSILQLRKEITSLSITKMVPVARAIKIARLAEAERIKNEA